MQGIFIHGSRPKSKKQVREMLERINVAEEHGGDPAAITALAIQSGHSSADYDPYGLVIEATSLFGDEFQGSIALADRQDRKGPFNFVGPDPYNRRKFYGTITKKDGKWICK